MDSQEKLLDIHPMTIPRHIKTKAIKLKGAMKIFPLLLILLLTSLTSRAQNITLRCDGNAFEACYVYIEGEIQADAGEKLSRLEIIDTNRVVLNSFGGNLFGGMLLGSVIRKLGLSTEVGKSIKRPEDFSIILADEGRCYSACAYAFLGGTERDSDSISKLGFHRFYNPIDFTDMQVGYAGQLRNIASEETQKISAFLVMYIVEMGVDARMLSKFQNYGADSIYTFSRPEGLAYGIVTNRRFGPWFIEPYGDSIVAATRKTGISTPYDQVYQVTTHCRTQAGNRYPYILLSIPIQDYSDPKYMASVGASMQFALSGKEYNLQIEPSYIRSWKDSKFMQIEIAINDSVAHVLTHVDRFDMSMNTGRAEGLFYYNGQTSKEEKNLIKASFLHCR